MTATSIAACRADTLLGYLKGLGIHRILSTQLSREVRASWAGESLRLLAPLDRSSLENFLLETYAPLPILNPWNNGAGFDGKEDRAASIIGQLRKETHPRWQAYRSTIDVIDRYVVATNLRDRVSKQELVQFLRGRYPDEALPWLDAAVVIGRDGASFPFLLGSGGNDGRLDFAVNFAARALDVVGVDSLPDRAQLLRDALDDTSEAKLLPDVAIGQFGPRYAGGVNGTSGFDASSLVNPWDLVLALEGVVAFCGGLSKKMPSGAERATFPFSYGVVASGYASASVEEAARGELWLPVWTGAATYQAVSTMFRSGRADMPSQGDEPQIKTAINSIQAAQAALTLGAGLGIERFERIGFVQRNGLAYSAAHGGTVYTANDPGIALLSRTAGSWIERVRSRRARLGKTVRDALARFDEGMFDYARSAMSFSQRHDASRARACAAMLIALADIDYALARRGHEELHPIDYFDAKLFDLLDDGSIEHRLALAIASLGFATPKHEIRLALENVRYSERGRLEYWPDANVSLTSSLEQTLGDICERRVTASQNGDAGWFRGSAGLRAGDLALLSAGAIDRPRVHELLRGYAIVRPPKFSPISEEESEPGEWGRKLPAAFALLKIVMDHPRGRDRRIIRLLRAGDGGRALALVMQKARMLNDLPSTPRTLTSSILAEPVWHAAAVLLPVRETPSEYAPLLNAALTGRSDMNVAAAYMNSLREEERQST